MDKVLPEAHEVFPCETKWREKGKEGETKHADLLETHDQALKLKRKAKMTVRTGMQKLARKYGYDPRSPW